LPGDPPVGSISTVPVVPQSGRSVRRFTEYQVFPARSTAFRKKFAHDRSDTDYRPIRSVLKNVA
jgi:hypothetical protein